MIETGRLYFLDPACRPLTGVDDVALHVRSARGPRPAPVVDCDDEAHAHACVTMAPGSDLLRRPDTDAVLRFTVHGEPCRILLRYKTPQTQTQETGWRG